MKIDDFLQRLDAVRPRGRGYLTRCPSHPDKTPSLTIAEGEDGRILLHDFGGCSASEIVGAMGLALTDLFEDAPRAPGQRPIAKPPRFNPLKVAFDFDLAALDRRLRAERVLAAINGFTLTGLSDDQSNRLMNAVASAYCDLDRAELFESLADSLRWKAWQPRRTQPHAA